MIVFRGCRCGKKLEEIVPNRYKCGFCNDEYPPNNLLLQSMLKLQVNDHRDEYHLVIYRELIERFFSLSVAIDKPEEEMVEMLFQKANTLQWRRFEFQVESGVSFETDKKCILLRPLDYVRYGWNLLRKLRQN